MRNILLVLSYLGGNYHGSQVQKNALSVTEAVQDAMQTVLHKREDVKGCSRTDAGVHARRFYMNFHTQNEISLYSLKRGLNALLPDDIGVIECFEVPCGFHARYSSVGKRYRYLIWTGEGKDPFLKGRALEYCRPLDINLINGVCKNFLGYHDFAGFCNKKRSGQDTFRTIYRCEFSRRDNLVNFVAEGDGFLYNMVRIIVGTMLRVNEGKISPRDVLLALSGGGRSFNAYTAPPWGLYLDDVFYTRPQSWDSPRHGRGADLI